MNGLQMLESNFVCQYKEYEDIFAKDYKDNELRESEKHIHVVTSPCGYTLVEADDRYTVYKEPDEWINIITDIKQVLNTTSGMLQYYFESINLSTDIKVMILLTFVVSTGHKNPVVLICGGKGVGKSTFARFVMNSLLNSCSEVCYLECDVGQTELTPPTILSLNRVTTPSLGPPFTHLKWPERAYFYGDVSPKDNPDLYIKSISSLYRHYQEILTTTPLVINTQGWVKGLGIPLLMDVIRITNPTHIVQINSQQTTKNLPAITREFLDTSPGWVWPTNDDQQDPSSKTILGDLVNSLRQEGGAKCADADVSDLLSRDQQTYPTVYQIDACLEVDQKSGSAFRPSDHRTMNMLAYFSHVLESSTNITTTNSLSHCIPYRIPWSHVAIHVNHTKIFETDDDDSEGFPKFLKETPIVECIGLVGDLYILSGLFVGIVRNIDPINRLFYILTPVPLDKLQRVNTLLKGNLEIPAPVLIQDSHPSMPYVSSQFSYDIKGAGARKVRYNLQRKKFNSPGRPEL
ncbi:hypothetical protein QZH41_011062 [Actinostola sp. cb2023]|nr:hypothetical protein QZH41_011062 [Actinostola sp. cb2023]